MLFLHIFLEVTRVPIAAAQIALSMLPAGSSIIPTPAMRFGDNVAKRSDATDRSIKWYVIAHHMVGNTYPYTIDDWVEDIKLAHASGIDAFALNIGPDSWQQTQVDNAYTAARQSDTGFKLFISFDMTVLPCSSAAHAETLRNYVMKYANDPAQFKYNGKVFVSTFAGQNCNFGQDTSVDGWFSQFYDQLKGPNAVFFVPSFFVDPATFSTYAKVMDGQFSWNSAWPISVTPGSFERLVQASGAEGSLVTAQEMPIITDASKLAKNLTSSLELDYQYISPLQKLGKLYMASVSPWFFTHYSQDTYNKNFVYLCDLLYSSRWQSIISARDSIQMVEIISWNDYGESHYIGPIKGAQPNSQIWVDGFDHTAWLDLTTYFATAYKTGSYPPVKKDKLYLWARPHARDAIALADSVGRPTNYQLIEDAVFVAVLATAPSTIVFSLSSQCVNVSISAGLSELSMPLFPGDTIRVALVRDDNIILEVWPKSFTFQETTNTYNYNAFVTMAQAA